MTDEELHTRMTTILDPLPDRDKRAVMAAGAVGLRILHQGGSDAEMKAAMEQATQELKNATDDEIKVRLDVELTAAEQAAAEKGIAENA